MATPCYTQVGFGFQRKLVLDFAGGTLTSDAGLVLLREFDDVLGLTDAVTARINDRRDSRYVTHPVATLIRQRLYQIAAGYEDVNDATRLRLDPTLQLVAGDGSDTALGSQPTLSRLENDLEWPTIRRLADVGIDWFCAHAYASDEAPREVLLDVDSTDDPTHGHQQLALFTGYYDQFMYYPLCWFEAHTGLPLRTRLRPGRTPNAHGLVEDLQQMLPKLRRRFPRARVRLRGDSGMATPRVEAALEDAGVEYVLAMGSTKTFAGRVARWRAKAEARYRRTGSPVSVCTSFRYRATRWPKQRRILVHVQVNALGTSVRFMVTNRPGRARDLIAWYAGRGTAENRIKELKLDLHADRLSCHRYRANAVRLQFHTLAYGLLAYFRRWLLVRTDLAAATIGHVRLRLLKIGARVVRSVRRVWFHLASSWPGRELFSTIHRALARAPA
jgi:Transposase DDE domain group 1